MNARSSAVRSAALLTPRGRGAVGTIEFRGDCGLIDAAEPPLFRAANGVALARQPPNAIVFGHWGRAPVEEVVVCRTAAEALEIHCHGGEAAVRRILADLQSAGVTLISWQDSLALDGGFFHSECLTALARATTFRTAALLLEQCSDILPSTLEDLRNAPWTEKGRQHARARLDDLLRWTDFGLHLSKPWTVVLAGRPNVGKSSLINALVGYTRSIVFDQPGTTRDVVCAETAFDGWPVQLADTAGIREQAERLEADGIARARRQLAEADCRLILFDISQPPHPDDFELLTAWPDAVPVAHKADIPDAWGARLPSDAVRFSSLTGAGVQDLIGLIVRRLVPQVPPRGTPLPVTARMAIQLEAARDALLQGDRDGFLDALAGQRAHDGAHKH